MIPSEPWFWIIIIGIIVFYVYILIRIIKTKEENHVDFSRQSQEEPLGWKVSKFKCVEIVGWVAMAIGFIALTFSILNFFSQTSLFITLFGSCLVIGGYLAATHYRKRRTIEEKRLKN